jgi:hypothetical protein
MVIDRRHVVLTTLAWFAASLGAQAAPAVHPLGPVLATSTEPLSAVSQVRALPDGRVLVHDNRGRRVVMFDSTFKRATIVVDSTSGTGNAYGSRIGGLIAARGDTSLFVDPASVSMLVINGKGKIVRTIAAPSPWSVQFMIGGPFGTPGTDPMGRLVYRTQIDDTVATRTHRINLATYFQSLPESSLIVRVELRSRKLDTVATFRIPQNSTRLALDTLARSNHLVTFVNPIPWTDDWAVLADGSIAVVRGQDYRVEIIGLDGKVFAGGKIPFEWQRLSDEDKAAIIDSTKVAVGKLRAAQFELKAAADAAKASTRQRPQPEGGGLVVTTMLDRNRDEIATATSVEFVDPSELPDYRPAFRQGASRGDSDGNLWIRTTKSVNGGSVYDVINNKGELTDRVLVPPGRVIAGFGPGGVVYMGVVDGEIIRLERARVR